MEVNTDAGTLSCQHLDAATGEHVGTGRASTHRCGCSTTATTDIGSCCAFGRRPQLSGYRSKRGLRSVKDYVA